MSPRTASTLKSKLLSKNEDYSAFSSWESNASRFHKPQTIRNQINNHFSDNHSKIFSPEFRDNEKMSEEEFITRLTTSPKSLHSSTHSSSSFFMHSPSNDLRRLERACGSSISPQKQHKSSSFLPLSYTLSNKSQSPKNNNIKSISFNAKNYKDPEINRKDISIKSLNSSEYLMKFSTNVSPIYPPSGHIENYLPLPDLMSDSRASTSSSEESEIKLIHSTPLCRVTAIQHTEETVKEKNSPHRILKEVIPCSHNPEHRIPKEGLNINSKDIFEKKSNIKINNSHINGNIHESIPYFSEFKESCNTSNLTMDKTIKLFGPGAWKTTPQDNFLYYIARPYIETLSDSDISNEKNKSSHILRTQNENHQRLAKMLLLLQKELKSTIINVEELELKIRKFEDESKSRIPISKENLLKLQLLYEDKKIKTQTYISLYVKCIFFIICIIFLTTNILNWILPIPRTYSELPLYQPWPT
ncbi:hypothetical protein PCK1_000766 [Pneumocystis canis]|nr:hypothetical protein PCK1_000766 [Pneumocystis canis]